MGKGREWEDAAEGMFEAGARKRYSLANRVWRAQAELDKRGTSERVSTICAWTHAVAITLVAADGQWPVGERWLSGLPSGRWNTPCWRRLASLGERLLDCHSWVAPEGAGISFLISSSSHCADASQLTLK